MSEPASHSNAPQRAAAPPIVAGSAPEPASGHANSGRSGALKISIAALGVAFGDIGTSPLYAVRECFHGPHAIAPTTGNVLGVLSLIFWSLTIIVSIKYVAFVLRADNKGEGGVLALMALTTSSVKSPRVRFALVALGVFGAALLYGDGVITPAITVLSAMEGLEVAEPRLHSAVIPLTVATLILLFAIQRRGTAGLGAVFGPIMLVWFTTLAGLGAVSLVQNPEVLRAMLPSYAALFLMENGFYGVAVLGAVFLVVTGSESLYADLGHFGRAPIRRAWFALAFPALFLNYLGQGALLIRDPKAAESPFYRMAPEWGLFPLVLLSTVASVIASQALISGVYSLSRQGTMLGVLPRVNIRHTSAEERGQIYVPTINYMLMLATIWLVLTFRSSSNLAAAYGIAMCLTMLITTIFLFVLAQRRWGWRPRRAVPVLLIFFIPELAFTAANAAKIEHGGWFPLLLAACLFVLMTTWQRGREILGLRFQEQMLPLADFYDLMRVERPARVPGTAVFMTSSQIGTPPSLLHNFLHNRVLHQHVVLLTIITEEVARVSERERYTLEELEEGFVRIIARYGFMEQPDVPRLLSHAGIVGKGLEGITFFLGRETMIANERPGMARWRVHVFAFLARNAQPATKFFNIPPDRVMEIGAQNEL